MAVKFDFKTLGADLTVDWPVQVSEPRDGGKVEISEFTAKFKVLSQDADQELHELARSEKGDPNAWIRGFFVGLGRDEGEFTPELLDLMLSRPFVKSALIRAYVACSQGVAAKN